MFFRGLAYVLLGWLAMAAVASVGHVFHLSVMLPSTSAVLLSPSPASPSASPTTMCRRAADP